MKISNHLIWCTNYYFLVHSMNGKTIQRTMHKLGVTEKQWRAYVRTGKLKVRPHVAAKMALISTYFHETNGLIIKDASNIPTLLKMLDARYGD